VPDGPEKRKRIIMNEMVTASTGTIPGFWIMMLKSIGMLCVVLAVLAGILFIFRQFTERRTGRINKRFISLMTSFHLGPKEKLMLVDVLGKKILLGVTQQTINTLAVLDDVGEFDVPEEKPDADFKGVLEKISWSTDSAGNKKSTDEGK